MFMTYLNTATAGALVFVAI